uniref:Restriction endonuclease subunit S n=1 Tax=Desulfacinum infernum TaxID=35837 RepID=A0A831ZZV3_9BACT
MDCLSPPLPEQTAIVEYLDEQTGKIDRAAEAARREVELLKEFRTRLIADVVTGKLDVRKMAENLPEEPLEEEAEILEEDAATEEEKEADLEEKSDDEG